MATDIVMPNLGFDTQEGRLIEWLKQVGDSVKRGEIIAIVESDKANVELESIASGILLEQLAAPDQVVQVGAIIARVGSSDEVAQQSSSVEVSAMPDASPLARRMAEDNQIDLRTIVGSGPKGRITREDILAHLQKAQPQLQPSGNGTAVMKALPKVRQAARAAGINLAEVAASGARGQITMADLERHRQPQAAPVAPVTAAAAPAPTPAPADGQEVSISRIRRIIGERLSKSMQNAPHFYVSGEFDLEAVIGALKALPAPQPGLNDLLQYITVQTLLRVPELNATFYDGKLYRYASINLAIAVAQEEGLITPVLPKAERYSLQGLAAESRELVRRARDNRLQPADLQNGTFTISNLGVVKQVEHFTAVINPPQVAILAVGTIKPRPVVVAGGLHVRSTVHLTLSGDHRVVDGMHLARFMAAFQEELDKFA